MSFTFYSVDMIYCCLVTKSCPTLQPHGLQPARLLGPWNFLGKNTRVGCHFLLQMVYYINSFLDVKPNLDSWDKSYLVMACSPFLCVAGFGYLLFHTGILCPYS